jgi:hypothetical protein
MFQVIIVGKIIFILGIVNIILVLMLFFSCRYIHQLPFGPALMKKPAFQKFFNIHHYIWWVFLVAVIAHGILAIGYFGVPF